MNSVKIIPELYNYFKKIENEIRDGIKTNEKEYNLIKKGIELLKQNYKNGEHISKRNQKAYSYYIKKYGIKNLWKLNVSKDWRIVYTLQGNQVEIISIILESLSHKEYERKFGYN